MNYLVCYLAEFQGLFLVVFAMNKKVAIWYELYIKIIVYTLSLTFP